MAILVKTSLGLCWVTDAEWKEGDHPRDKDGKFASGAGGSAPSQQSKWERRKRYSEYVKRELKSYSREGLTELTTERAREAVHKGMEAMKNGAHPADAISIAILHAKGYVYRAVGRVTYQIEIGGDIANESRRNVFLDPSATPEKTREIAQSTIEAVGDLPGIIKFGRFGRWGDPASDHPGQKALTILGSFVTSTGERKKATVDLLKSEETEQVESHNLNVEGAPTFAKKMAHLIKLKSQDEATEVQVLKVVGLQVL